SILHPRISWNGKGLPTGPYTAGGGVEEWYEMISLGISELTQKDLEGPACEIVKVFIPDVCISIPEWKKATNFSTDQVDDAIQRNNSAYHYRWLIIPGLSHTTRVLFNKDLGISTTQLNLTKPRWDAKGFEYKHDFTVIDSPRAVTFKDKYGVQMIMRFNEIHKFSDGTLHQIDEALDYRVKEFRVNKERSRQDVSSGIWKALLVARYEKETTDC
ncbi:hypothetical protein Tco_1091501, partial [Tanacetum coccineum]